VVIGDSMKRMLFGDDDLVTITSGRYKGCDAKVLVPLLRYSEEGIIVRILITTDSWPKDDRLAGVYQHRLLLVEAAACNPNSAFKRLKMSRR